MPALPSLSGERVVRVLQKPVGPKTGSMEAM